MKRYLTWKPRKVEQEGEIFIVVEKIGDTVFLRNDKLVSPSDFRDGIILGFQKLHEKECLCSCHAPNSEIEEPCENCKANDQGFLVKVLVPRYIHISCLTKDRELGRKW